MNDRLLANIKEAEGFRSHPYLDCCGKLWRSCVCAEKGSLTIGYGRNLDARGVSRDEADILVRNDVISATIDAEHEFEPWIGKLSQARFDALVELTFNMGIGTLTQKNPKMLAAFAAGLYRLATLELLDGSWHEDVGPIRAGRIVQQIDTGGYVDA